MSHGVFETWLHPSRYRTKLCNDGLNCSRRVCFFAHNLLELRPGADNQDDQENICLPAPPTLPSSLESPDIKSKFKSASSYYEDVDTAKESPSLVSMLASMCNIDYEHLWKSEDLELKTVESRMPSQNIWSTKLDSGLISPSRYT